MAEYGIQNEYRRKSTFVTCILLSNTSAQYEWVLIFQAAEQPAQNKQ